MTDLVLWKRLTETDFNANARRSLALVGLGRRREAYRLGRQNNGLSY
jgi:hypothetical protein